MKRLFIFCALVAALAVTGCKTNEKNYRAAYEMARQNERAGIDSTIYEKIRREARPSTLDVDGRTLPVLTVAVRLTPGDDAVKRLYPYCVAVAQFKQLFNARAMVKRLRDNGYVAFLVENREPLYYVIAGGAYAPDEAISVFDRISSDGSVVLREPYPFILRPVGVSAR
ncbi:MAG: SPOR domain-containing protein [Pseudoflavonifractor sp.]|nr:SPOR domain-containing protein [Pseudoflavonifractor sp.]